MIHVSLPLLLLVVGTGLCAPEHGRSYQVASSLESDEVRHNIMGNVGPSRNLGKRLYSYVSEYKRLPVYNFGLGKRYYNNQQESYYRNEDDFSQQQRSAESRPYSFGLGKRSIDEDTQPEEDFSNDLDQESLADFLEQYDDAGNEVKRARPYSFGLGKRYDEEISEEKRARTYNFGLGKRIPLYNFGLGKRARNYNFGLGKRLSSKFNFGLGKRQRDLHRFNFGLGKRSGDDDNENIEA